MKMGSILNTILYLVLIIFISKVKTLHKIRHFNTYGLCDVLTIRESLYVSGIKCDSLKMLYPSSKITHLFINGTSISTFADIHVSKFPNLLHLEITHSKLEILDFNLFCYLTELKTLNVAHNKIFELRSKKSCIIKNLTDFIVSHNAITSLENITHSLSVYMPYLTYLDMSENNLTTIEDNDFLYMSSLEVLSLSSCNLNYIHPNSLPNLQNLKTLILSKNNLMLDNMKEILRNFIGYSLEELDIFSFSSPLDTTLLSILNDLKLKELKFGDTNVPVIKKNTFVFSSNLKELSISNTNIANITDDAFQNLPNLTSLTIVPNILDILPKGILLSKLEYLNISGRTWKPKKFTILDFSFASMSNLHTLDLSFNFLIRLKEGTFMGLSNLKHLYIRRCGIHHIEDVTFTPFYNLLSLDISFNTILITKYLIRKIFHHLITLKTLFFQQVPLTLSADDNPFSELIHLELIDLSNTSLNLVSQNLFANLTKIKHIYLSHNLIREWREPIFSSFPNLVSLDLSHNYIVTATGAMLDDFSKIQYVNLSGNYFNCSCDILPFLEWINNSEIIISGFFKRDHNRYKCDSPKELLNSELFKVHHTLMKECTENPAFAILIVLSVLLILVLGIVLGGYLYKFHFGRRLMTLTDNKNFIYDAFISYNANDSEWVFRVLLPHLETNTSDLKLCVYDRDFVAGRGISECILDSIKCSRRTILILSNNFLQSPWCKFETDLAHHVLIDEEREGLLLIKLENLLDHLVNPQLNYLLKTKIYLEWSEDPKEQDLFWKKLHQALKNNNKNTSKII